MMWKWLKFLNCQTELELKYLIKVGDTDSFTQQSDIYEIV